MGNQDPHHSVLENPHSLNQQKEMEEGELEGEDEYENDVELSLCSHLISEETKLEEINNIFEANRIAFENFSTKPLDVLADPRLLIKIEDKLYNWQAAAPLILSLLAYKKPLPEKTMDELIRTPAANSPGKAEVKSPSSPFAFSSAEQQTAYEREDLNSAEVPLRASAPP